MTGTSRTRGSWVVALAVLVTLLLAACGGLPTDGEIHRGLPVRGNPLHGVQVLPDPPSAGADQEEIIRGFLRANVGFTGDHDVAREYLTPSLAAEWKPTSRVLVHTGESGFELTRPDERSVAVTVSATATLDEQGYFSELPEGTQRSGTFGLTRVEDQWRISSFPQDFGVWLSAPDFDRLYRGTSIHYVSPASRVIVPDVRWFPRGPGLATALARAQMQEVPSYLRGAVRTGVPTGTHLSVDAVPVESGVAVVDLTGSELSESSSEDRRALWAQFVLTLAQVPGVGKVSLQSGGRTLEVPGAPEALSDIGAVGYRLASGEVDYALRRTGTELRRIDPYQSSLGPYTGNSGDELPELPEIPVEWVDLAASADVTQIVAVSEDGTRLARWQSGDQHVMPEFGQDLTRPSFDDMGGLWVGGASATGSKVWVVDTGIPMTRSVARPVEAPWIGEREVVAFRVAADNQRAVVVLRDPRTDQYEMGITGIVRGADGEARSLSSPLRIAPTLTAIEDVTWLDQTTVAVLGRGGASEAERPYLIPLSGYAEQLSPLEGAESIVGVPGADEEQLLAVTDSGRIATRDGSGWYTSLVGSDLVVPGT